MIDPTVPPPAPAASVEPRPEPPSLPPNLSACLACVFPLVGGLVVLGIEKRNAFVRFYAMQSIYFGGATVVLTIAYSIISFVLLHIPIIGWLLLIVLWLLGIALMLAWLFIYVMLIVRSLSGQEWEVPFIGRLARQQVAQRMP